MLLVPIIILLFAVIIIFTSISSAFTTLSKGGETVFNSSKIVDYGMEKYSEIYNPASKGYEDNIVVVFLVDTDEYYDYSFVGIVGNHVNSRVVDLFGNEQTALGRAFNNAIPDNYEHSLTLNLKSVISSMSASVKNTGSSDDFDCREDHNLGRSKLVNYSAISIDETTINTVLEKFTEETGITISLVVDEQVDVYGKTISPSTILFALIGVALIVFAIVSIVKTIKNNRNNNNNGQNNGSNNGGYNGGGYNGGGSSSGGTGERININKLF